MREIKFRGKAVRSLDKLNESNINHVNGWVYGNLVMYDDMPFIVVIPFVVVNLIEADIYDYWVKVQPESVGQYTGLKDKNGKEIYEGDILHCIFEDENYIVEWDEIGAGFLFHRINNKKRTGGIDYYEFEDICGSFGFEVIGNIFQDGDLLHDS